jgi:hypothetical protein
MANQRFAASPNERTGHSGAIANVSLHVPQCLGTFMDKHEIGNIKDTRATGTHAISDSWRKNGMLNRERFKCDAANLRRRALFDQTTVFDGVISQCSPGFLRRMHRTTRAPSRKPHA